MQKHCAVKKKKYEYISAFDLDHTLLSINSSYLLGKMLFSAKLVKLTQIPLLIGTYFSHKMNLTSLHHLHQIAFESVFYKKNFRDFEYVIQEFIHKVPTFINLTVWEELKKAVDRQHYIVILSSSPDLIVRPIAQALNIPIWDSTRYVVDKDENFFKISLVMDGLKKAEHLRNLKRKLQVDSASTYVYTDSILDMPFMLEAGNPTAVNPDRKLRKICLQNQWKII